MKTTNRFLVPHIEAEIELSLAAGRQGLPERAFWRLERAHILSQTSIAQHLRVHWLMLRFAAGQRLVGEALSQLLRLLLVLPGSVSGRIPVGNTGGGDVNPFQPMSIPADLQVLIDAARRTH